METKIYTIGHSNQSMEDFISLLKKYDVNCVVDVRSNPFSKYALQFNKRELQFELKREDIVYIWMGKEFGARREEKSLYDPDGRLDFNKTKKSKAFLAGVRRIKEGIRKGYVVALMCTEKEPQDCHRSILVGKSINEIEGYSVINILEDGSIVKQDEIGEMLINHYYPNRAQMTISEVTGISTKTENEYLEDAYTKRAKEIANQIE